MSAVRLNLGVGAHATMAANHPENYEDILNDSLEFLGGQRVVDSEVIRYGPLSLTVAPKAIQSTLQRMGLF
ncbi:hypothetical protein HGRIS_003020 [Hohenbuehelia grisea]|uniref:Uncharacterized protein n=1 Tax=Hohenbuehelia grisea TaxID=104357 RepID=A0ABR3JMZ8_9AGAR